jgi:hypothetical protein
MSDVLLELIFNAAELATVGIRSRDEIEEPLEEALSDLGLGEITGGGAGSGTVIIDVEIGDEKRLDEALLVIRKALQALQVPPSTFARRAKPVETHYRIYD